MSVLPTSQNKRRALVRNLMIVIGTAMLALTVAGRTMEIAVHWPLLALLLIFSALAILQFETLDEVAKQGQYVAWYWGSLLGIVVVLAIQLLFSFTGQPFSIVQDALTRWFGDADPMTSFLSGMMLTPVLMVVGFFVCWGVFWLRRR
ncbi:MAG: hypothetical protein J0L81_14475 [Caulobacterales bacterium]|jgi:uncharacterized membrane protein|nr:hypothetical protein [Caulobacterales bacterium]